MKTVKYYAKTRDGSSFDIELKLKRDFSKKDILEAKDALKKKVLDDYKAKGYDIELLELKITVPSKISKEKLNEIGHDIASTWGAECTSVKTYESLVEFSCIEDGERFRTYMTYDELKEEYHIG